ncbi:hypothetical protein GCM10025879_04120 [Leuconostoc litchii]|uniref:glycerophosphodiester phosphodiesterase family protein n=1 Tax=Leuconostoc litchii TaxID=1981069 RepID=UPI0023E9CC2C|nr:glycerophosphodiester phosphodiesterase family protein [Leuconostoc litchii]GMA69166.1 hypothetical protein GCM10025879_04120 [Leuconostoc litchii]
MIVLSTALMYVISAYVLNLYIILLSTHQKHESSQKIAYKSLLFQGAILVLIGMGSTFISGRYFITPRGQYLVIAHKGVSQLSAEPNSVNSLKNTIATKPDYIEIDIQPTKDGVYVLTHNTKVTTVSGKNIDISKTNWSDLKSKKIEEAGHQFYLSSFSKYLAVANKNKQKLLIELKLNDTATNKQLQQFVNNYGHQMVKNHSQIQSMNQNVVKRLHMYTNLTTGLLSPVKNNINRSKVSQFYAIEYSKVDAGLSNKINHYNKNLYSWTVNDKFDIETAYMLGVYGVITDKPKETREILQNVRKNMSYHRAFISMVFSQQNDI